MAVPSPYDPNCDALLPLDRPSEPPRSGVVLAREDRGPRAKALRAQPAPSRAPGAAEPIGLRPQRDRGAPGADSIVRPRVVAPQEVARPTRAEVDLSALRHNYREVRAWLEAQSEHRPPAKLWAVLKADAYGHGARSVATTLERAGVHGICVALIEEGIELRSAGVRCPILVLGGAYGRFRDGMEAIVRHGLTAALHDPADVDRLASAAEYVGTPGPIAVHVDVDTGAGSFGVRAAEITSLAAKLRRSRWLRVEGLMAQLSGAAEGDWALVAEQLGAFRQAEQALVASGIRPAVRHVANSAAAIRWPASHFDVVRVGIALFGVNPIVERAAQGPSGPKLRPALRVVSEVAAIRDVGVGQCVGDGHRWLADRPSRLGTVALGYADGLPRAACRGGQVLVAGKRAPIVGSVSADFVTIDLTDHPATRLHDEVVVLGSQRGSLGEDTLDAWHVAALTDTIPHEVLTGISRRVPRFYRHA